MTPSDVTLPYALILIVTGFVAGVINTMAGGGTNLTLPALMVLGMPADVANATNRVGVMMQCGAGVAGFRRKGRLPVVDLVPILLPTLAGGVLGAIAAGYAPAWLLKPLLLGAMVCMTLVMLFKPAVIVVPAGTAACLVSQRPRSRYWLLFAGFYGGFVQAGVGFILLSALAGALRYDLVRANALKMVCVSVFTSVALGLFVVQGLVAWVPGLILGVGAMLGTGVGVNISIAAKPNTLKWLLFVMTVCGAIAAMRAS